MNGIKRIAILGAGPSSLFLFKRLVESGESNMVVDIFEKEQVLGAGMPYSKTGANVEHITNVSGNEIPELLTSVLDWLKTLPEETLQRFNIEIDKVIDYKVLPRLLFGQYLTAQFNLLQTKAKVLGIEFNIYFNSLITDIIDVNHLNKVLVEVNDQKVFEYDQVVICTGHSWPKKYEDNIPGYFDSPYPPQKLKYKTNHSVALKGSSLTAIDAIRTLSRANGRFMEKEDGKLEYELDKGSEEFKMMMHSRQGMLPAVRFHLEDSHLQNDSVLTAEEIEDHRTLNDGFLSLDFVFENNFKLPIKDKDPELYESIKDLSLEEFVAKMTELRERLPAFQLFSAEFAEASQSIKRRESVYWKEMLAVLSFTLNYPAKYLCAEDMMRLQKVLMPLISIVIAFVPQSSVAEMLALYQAGVLDIVSVGDDSEIEIQQTGGIVYHYLDEDNKAHAYYYKTFIDCVGQPHIEYEDFPFKSLLKHKAVSRAKIKFKEDESAILEQQNGNLKVSKDVDNCYYLRVPGITINDHFQVVDEYGAFNERIYIMAVPYIGGYNPDYSGLDFCEAASAAIVPKLLET